MASSEIRHIVGQAADPISVIEGAHAWAINLAGNRRVTVIRPDGLALEVWPSAYAHSERTRESDGTVMLGWCLINAITGIIAFALGAWIF